MTDCLFAWPNSQVMYEPAHREHICRRRAGRWWQHWGNHKCICRAQHGL